MPEADRMGVKITGLDALQRKLAELARRAETLSGEHQVQMSQLLTPEFMLLNTDYDCVESMFDASAYDIKSQADFDAIPADEWDAFIHSHTRFDTT
jgi:hypothetical protein